MKLPLIVSYYTKNTPYEKEVEDLKKSISKHDLESHIMGIDSFGSWEKNCGFKPLFIKKMLETHKRPLIWVDADATIEKKPVESADWTCSFATRINQEYDKTDPSYCMTGTVYVKPSIDAMKILDAWIDECLSSTPIDQIALRDAIFKNNLIVSPIPLSYVALVYDEEEANGAVILHHQASRSYRHIIDGEVASGLFEEFAHLSSEEIKQLRAKAP